MEQTIFRANRTERDKWTPVLNETIRDSRISYRATGLLMYLLSLPPDWKTSQQHIATLKTEGRDAVITAWNELRQFGYVTKEIVRDHGRITTTIWNIFETPHRFTEKPETAEPETVNPTLRSNEGNEQRNGRIPHSPQRGRSGIGQDKIPTTDQSRRFAAIVHRMPTTAWTQKEIRAYKKLGVIPEENLAAVEAYYKKHWPPNRDKNILRHDLFTLLNNFSGEIDRANTDLGRKASKENQWTASNEPKGWKNHLREKYPQATITTWEALPDDVKREVIDDLKSSIKSKIAEVDEPIPL